MIRLSVQIQSSTGDREQRTHAFEKVYEPFTGFADLMRDYEKSLKAFYGIKEDVTQDADTERD